MPMRARTKRPLLLLFVVIAVCLAMAAMVPWSFHMGGRWTPLMTWWGAGTLRTKAGVEYPLFLYVHPAAHSSELRLDGLRPSSGVGGFGCLCTPGSGFQALNLIGMIYGVWRSTDGGVLALQFREPGVDIVVPKQRGGFELTGGWDGQELVMADREPGVATFSSGLRIEQPSVRLRPGAFFWSCHAACATAAAR